MWAATAAGVVVHHDPSADACGTLPDTAPDRGHNAAWLMSGDDRPFYLSKPKRRGAPRGPIEFEIAAAHSRSLDLDDDFTGPRRRIGELGDVQSAVTKKGNSAHGLCLPAATKPRRNKV